MNNIHELSFHQIENETDVLRREESLSFLLRMSLLYSFKSLFISSYIYGKVI